MILFFCIFLFFFSSFHFIRVFCFDYKKCVQKILYFYYYYSYYFLIHYWLYYTKICIVLILLRLFFNISAKRTKISLLSGMKRCSSIFTGVQKYKRECTHKINIYMKWSKDYYYNSKCDAPDDVSHLMWFHFQFEQHKTNERKESEHLSGARKIIKVHTYIIKEKKINELTFWSPNLICLLALRLTFMRHRNIRCSPSNIDCGALWWCALLCWDTLRPNSACIEPWSCLSIIS